MWKEYYELYDFSMPWLRKGENRQVQGLQAGCNGLQVPGLRSGRALMGNGLQFRVFGFRTPDSEPQTIKVILMADVAITFKVLPQGIEEFESVKSEIAKMNPHSIGEEPIAFGFKAVRVTFIMGDEGGVDELEQKLSAINGVSSVDTVSVGRIN